MSANMCMTCRRKPRRQGLYCCSEECACNVNYHVTWCREETASTILRYIPGFSEFVDGPVLPNMPDKNNVKFKEMVALELELRQEYQVAKGFNHQCVVDGNYWLDPRVVDDRHRERFDWLVDCYLRVDAHVPIKLDVPKALAWKKEVLGE